MRSGRRNNLVTIGLATCLAAAAVAQGAALKITEEKPGLFKKAKIAPAEAQTTAQARFPAATIKSGELEMENGKLIYTFDIQQPGVTGIEEVNIDATTGAIISATHENPPPPKPTGMAPKPPKKPPAS